MEIRSIPMDGESLFGLLYGTYSRVQLVWKPTLVKYVAKTNSQLLRLPLLFYVIYLRFVKFISLRIWSGLQRYQSVSRVQTLLLR